MAPPRRKLAVIQETLPKPLAALVTLLSQLAWLPSTAVKAEPQPPADRGHRATAGTCARRRAGTPAGPAGAVISLTADRGNDILSA